MQNRNSNDDIELYSGSNRDIYSNIREDIYSSSKNKRNKKKKSLKRKLCRLIIVLSVIVIFLVGALYAYTYNLINKVNRVEVNKEELNISTNEYDDVKNIALLGIDTRKDNDSGRADANIIITIDKKNNKIKLTSIARDSYVKIEGHGNDKLTHAYAYGKSENSVKTLNENFDLEITDYVTVNFFGLARIIDYIGGVTVEIDKKEFSELNNNIIPHIDFGNIPCEKIKGTGLQKLTGTQAVCYSRIRKIDGDIERGNRQKEVLTAMFNAVKSKSLLSLPKVAELILNECETTLSTNYIISLGSWAVLNSPQIEQISIPNDNVKGQGKIIKGVWYYVYDIENAKKEIYNFIMNKENYSKENVSTN